MIFNNFENKKYIVLKLFRIFVILKEINIWFFFTAH